MNAFGYMRCYDGSARILRSCLHATLHSLATSKQDLRRFSEAIDLELSFEFYDGFFLVLEGAAFGEGSLGSPVLEF